MTFRDDHDAALARADALQVELDRVQAERDKLKADLDAAKQPKPRKKRAAPRRKRPTQATASTPSDSDHSTGKGPIIIGVAVAAVFGFAMLLRGPLDCSGQRAHDAWARKVEARQAHVDRWNAVIAVEPCVRMIAEMSALRSRLEGAPIDQISGYGISQLISNCTGGAQALVADRNSAAPVRVALDAWLAAERELAAPVGALRAYYDGADWKEDGGQGGRALWAALAPHLARRVEAWREVRRAALPLLRDEIRALQAAHLAEHGKDDLWWRIELGLALWAVNELAHEARGLYDGRLREDANERAAARVREPVAALLAAAKEAPIEVRRTLRERDWLTGPLAAGQPPGVDTFFHLAHPDGDLFRDLHGRAPAMPPDPGPEPEYSDDTGGGGL